MRRIRSHLEMSVDGVVESPERWAHAYFSEEMLQAAQAGMRGTDTLLFGRRTYEEFAAYWPHQDPRTDPFARFLNETRKLVASNTLQSLEWGPAELISGDVPKAVADLKRTQGGEVTILGSTTLVASLLRARILDTLELMIVPVLIGTGRRLFAGDEQVPLSLMESRTFENGAVMVTYERADGQ